MKLCTAGATVIANLSASDETIGKRAYRRSLFAGQSARLVCGYVYADAGEGESTTDHGLAGHNLIAENGALLAERRFAAGLTVSEVDVARLVGERRRMCLYQAAPSGYLSVPSTCRSRRRRSHGPSRPPRSCPRTAYDRAARCEEILLIASLGLKKRLEHTDAKAAVVGLSGGLDSTLAVLITTIAIKMLGRPLRTSSP